MFKNLCGNLSRMPKFKTSQVLIKVCVDNVCIEMELHKL